MKQSACRIRLSCKASHITISILFTLIAQMTFGQLAKVRESGAFDYELELKRVLTFPYKKIKYTEISDVISDNNGGFLNVYMFQGNLGIYKSGPYINFLQLDKSLQRKGQASLQLQGDDLPVQPIGYFISGDIFNLITIAVAESGAANFAYTEIDLKSFNFLKKNVLFAKSQLHKDRQYEFYLEKSPDQKTVAILGLEEVSKKENLSIHSIVFSEDFRVLHKKVLNLPFIPKKGVMNKILLTNSGKLYALMTYQVSKDEDDKESVLAIASKDKSQLYAVQKDNIPVINGNISLTPDGDVLIAGLLKNRKKGFNSFVVGRVKAEDKIDFVQEQRFSEILIREISESEKDGIAGDYKLTSVTERENGIVDVVFDYVRQYYGGGNGESFYTQISDLIILSLKNNSVFSTTVIPRNYNTGGGAVSSDFFSVQKVFSKGNQLFVFYLANPDSNRKRPKRADANEGKLILLRLDANGKKTEQQLVELDKKNGFKYMWDVAIFELGSNQFMLKSERRKVFKVGFEEGLVHVDLR